MNIGTFFAPSRACRARRVSRSQLRAIVASIALVLASVIPAVAVPSGEMAVLPEDRRAGDWVMEFDARFAAGAPRDFILRLFSPRDNRPDAKPASWCYTKTTISFAGNWTRTLEWVCSGYTGTPFMERHRYLLPFDVPDGEWRHARVVADKGYMTFYVQFGDRMQRTLHEEGPADEAV